MAGLSALASSKANEEDKMVKTPRLNTLGAEEMATIAKGVAMVDPGESVVRTENFGRMNDILERIDKSINNQKLSFNVETHHNTRYR